MSMTLEKFLKEVEAEAEAETDSNYINYRGKCKELCEKFLKENPDLILTKGWYHCPMWGKQEHWWLKDTEGKIVDPSVKQFPFSGAGEYEEFAGYYDCGFCGKKVHEDDVLNNGHHVYCSDVCLTKDIGL